MTRFKPLCLLLMLLTGCAQQPASVQQPATTPQQPKPVTAQTMPAVDVAQAQLDTVEQAATGVTLQLSQVLQQQFEAGKQQLLAQDYQQAVVQFIRRITSLLRMNKQKSGWRYCSRSCS